MNKESYVFIYRGSNKIEDIKIIIQTYFCHPFSGYIEMNIDANNPYKIIFTLKIKDTNIDFAYINVEIIKDKNTGWYFDIKLNKINSNLKNKINSNLKNKNRMKIEINNKKNLFLLLLSKYLENNNYGSIIKFVYDKISEFLSHDKNIFLHN
jgi:hypothetical protein